MKNIIKILLLSFGFSSFSVSGQKLETENGNWEKLDLKNSVVVFFDSECPNFRKYTKTLKEVIDTYQSQGIHFYFVYPYDIPPEQSFTDFKKEYEFDFPFYIDKNRKLMKKLKATTSPEAFLLNNRRKTIYHGAIDNWFYALGKSRARPTRFYLIDAIESHLKNQKPKEKYIEPIGCLL